MVREFLSAQQSKKRSRGQSVITIIDDHRVEQYDTLSEAVAAVKIWYSKLAGRKLPMWNYRVQNFDDFAKAIDDYKARIAKALRYGKNYQHKLRLTVFRRR